MSNERKIYSVEHCFGCRDGNILKLKLKNQTIGDRSHVEVDVTEEYCGHPHVLHGGVICTLFDEVMYYAFAQFGIDAVTTAVSVRYHAPTLAGTHIILEAWQTERRGNRIKVKSEMKDTEGKLLAEAEGTFFAVDVERLIKHT